MRLELETQIFDTNIFSQWARAKATSKTLFYCNNIIDTKIKIVPKKFTLVTILSAI